MSDSFEIYMDNIRRTRNFITLYEKAKSSGPGRKDTLTTDILRSGTVFLHATVEEYLRTTILDCRLKKLEDKDNSKAALINVSLPGDNSGHSKETKYKVMELLDYREFTVDELLKESLKDKTSYLTFNEYSQIVSSLNEVGIHINDKYDKQELIDGYIKRRHKIVHEGDKNENKGSGNYRTASINATQLNSWIEAADELINLIEEEYRKLYIE